MLLRWVSTPHTRQPPAPDFEPPAPFDSEIYPTGGVPIGRAPRP